MRTALIIILTIQSCLLVQGQAGKSNLETQYNAQGAARYIQVSYSPATIKTLEGQRRAWEQVVKADPADAGHWFNYYMATRLYYLQTNNGTPDSTGKSELAAIAQAMDSAIPAANNFEQLMVSYFEAREYKQAAAYLDKAFEKEPHNPFVKTELPKYFFYKGETTKARAAVSNVQEVSGTTALYGFCRAMVHSLPDTAIIITNGDYDTYASWLGVATTNKNIQVISLKWLADEGLRARMLSETGLALNTRQPGNIIRQLVKQNSGKKIFISLTVNPGYFNEIKKSLYNTGYCYQYSEKVIDNIELLYNNLVLFRTEIYKPIGSSGALRNCMPGYITLFRHYKNVDKERAGETIREAKELAEKGGFWNEYSQYFE